MAEIEAILNSRPLTPMSSDANDLSALTPGHFLIGEPLTSIVDPHAQPVKSSLLQRWKLVSHLKHEFWQRWTKEYLSELQHRHKWKNQISNVYPGIMVILKEDNTPVLKWPLGRIIQVIKGSDGLVRVADVKTATGILRRPIHKLAPLPVTQEKEDTDILPSTDPSKQKDGCHSSMDNQPNPSDIEDSDKDHQGPSNAKKPRHGNPALALLLLTSLILPISGQRLVDVKPFSTQPGLYFEGLGSIHLVSNEWNLVIYYNMIPYWAEFRTVRNVTSMLSRICKLMKESESCTQTVSQFNAMINELHNNNELLTVQTPSRVKRAPLNIIGNLANTLFGVLDSDYAERMTGVIQNLEGNQEHLLDLLRNQTSILDATANIFKRSQEAIDHQLQEFEIYINDSIAEINKIEQELHDQKIAEIFNALSIRLILLTTNYQKIQSMLLDVIIDTRHGKINPLLITPSQLQAQIILIKENLPPTLRLPTNRNNLLEVYNLMTIEGRVSSNEIIFRLKLPLFSYEPFELLRIVSVPVPVNDTFLTIEPASQYLIVNFHRDQYYPLSDQEMSMCVTVGSSTYMCKQHHPIYRKGSTISACEIGFLTQSPSPSSCKIARSNIAPRWIQLFQANHWIYITKEDVVINTICKNGVSQTTLHGTGILHLSAGCAIRDDATTIQAHNLYPSSLQTSFVPTNNLTDLLNPFEVAQLAFHPLPHLNISEDIMHLKGQIELLRNKETSPFANTKNHIHQFSISYIGFIVATSILAYIACRFFIKRHRRNSQQSAPVPAPRTSTFQPDNQDLAYSVVEQTVQRGGGC